MTATALPPAPATGHAQRRLHVGWWLPAGVATLVLAFFAGVSTGPAGPAWWRVPLALVDHLPLVHIDSGVTPQQWDLIYYVRMPRVVLAGIVGAMLSLAGASYQGVFRNPLVDPYLLGVAAGAGLGATLVFSFGGSVVDSWPVDPLPLSAFAFGLAAVAVTYTVGGAFGAARSPTTLVLAGVAVTALATAMQTFVLQRHTEVIRRVYSWILGTLSTATWADVRLVTPYVVVASAVLIAHRRLLDVLRVGDDEAAALGTHVERTRLVVVLAATLGTAAVVAVTGLIGFVGIIVPHTVRLITGASYRRVVPLSLLLGAAFLIVADIPSRTLDAPAEVPIGVVTAFLGAPFFLVVLRTSRRRFR